jgi:hypothetical protein
LASAPGGSAGDGTITVIDPSGEGVEGICADCKEHCGVEYEEEESSSELLTPRKRYWVHLHKIAEITGQLNRRMSFVEASTWLVMYDEEITTGYPSDMAAQRSYDCHFAARRGFVL